MTEIIICECGGEDFALVDPEETVIRCNACGFTGVEEKFEKAEVDKDGCIR